MKKIIFPLAGLILVLSSCELPEDEVFTSDAERLEGAWQVDETSSVFKSTLDFYQVYIYPDENNESQIYIENFYMIGRDYSVLARLNGNSILIPSQVVDGFSISGSGTISSDFETIVMSYAVDDGSGTVDDATAEYTKLY